MARRGWRRRLGNALIRWGQALKPATAAIRPATTPQKRSAVSQMPGLRSPLTIDKAVRNRDLSVLKREASEKDQQTRADFFSNLISLPSHCSSPSFQQDSYSLMDSYLTAPDTYYSFSHL